MALHFLKSLDILAVASKQRIISEQTVFMVKIKTKKFYCINHPIKKLIRQLQYYDGLGIVLPQN